MNVKKIAALAAVGLLLAMASSSYSQGQASAQSVRKLMDLTGTGSLGVQVMQSMLPGLKQMVPQVPESFWNEFMKEVDPDELVELVVPIYQRHFTEAEIQATIDFYESPAGVKLAQKLPVITQESMLAGQQWGQQVAMRAVEKARAAQQQ